MRFEYNGMDALLFKDPYPIMEIGAVRIVTYSCFKYPYGISTEWDNGLEPGDKLVICARPYPNQHVVKVSLWGREFRTTQAWLHHCTIAA